jgi:hypothetical protein
MRNSWRFFDGVTFHGPIQNDALAIFDGQDILSEDAWIAATVAEVQAKIDLVKCVVSNDRNWIFVNPRDYWQFIHGDDEDRGARAMRSPEIVFGTQQFDRRKKLLVFHRGDKEPKLVDRFEDAVGPMSASVDKQGEVQLWYEKGYLVRGAVQMKQVCVSLDGSRVREFEMKAGGPPLPNTLDLEQSAWVGIRAYVAPPRFKPHETQLLLKIDRFTWKYREYKTDNLAVELEKIFERKDGLLVPKAKPAIPIENGK